MSIFTLICFSLLFVFHSNLYLQLYPLCFVYPFECKYSLTQSLFFCQCNVSTSGLINLRSSPQILNAFVFVYQMQLYLYVEYICIRTFIIFLSIQCQHVRSHKPTTQSTDRKWRPQNTASSAFICMQ